MGNKANSNEKKHFHFFHRNKENEFPQGTLFEKELNLNFKYFNIFWYDPNKSNDFDNFKKCFENVQVYKGFDIESTIKFFQKESSLEEWIVISPEVEELISKLHDNTSIKAFFIYSLTPGLEEDWTKKYIKIKCITGELEVLTKKLIEINKDYFIPNFKYDEEKKKKIDFDLNQINKLKSGNKFALRAVLRENNDLIKAINRNKNKYNIFCMKTIHYLKNENCVNLFKETKGNENAVFYHFTENIKLDDIERLTKIITFVRNITLISLYFSSYPYIFNLFSYKEVHNLINNDITPKNYIQLYNEKAYLISEKLYKKLMNSESIINDKEDLKCIQTFAILFSFYAVSINKNKEFIDFYQINNFYRDIDFCLKYLVYYFYLVYKNGNNIFANDLISALNECDYRKKIFNEYESSCLKTYKPTLKPEELSDLNKSLTIKDFLVVGGRRFSNKIRNIEKDINFKTIKYLKIDDISNYIKEKNIIDVKKKEFVTYFYYLIISLNKFKKNFEKIFLLSNQLGVTFYVIIYIKDDILFNKIPVTMTIFLPIILTYSPEDIITFLSKTKNFNLLEDMKKSTENDPELLEFLKVPIPKLNFEDNNDDIQDGCFELSETFDINIIKNKIVRLCRDSVYGLSSICYNLYLTYSENNALDLFFKYTAKYYGFTIYPENINFDLTSVKRFLYMYCREEVESKKSLYYMLNHDLKTRNPAKIYRYIEKIASINKSIENEELASYKGKVYRATKLNEELILKLEPGKIMVNTTFWSTSKDFKVAERFLKGQKWRNAFIYCQTVKNNIDIDYENLNYFAEKEVLFLPFTQFKVEKVTFENKYERKLFTIELTELGTKNPTNLENMQIVNINDINYMNFCDELTEQKKNKEDKYNENIEKVENENENNI